jgi:hypothetical protein
VYDPPLFHSHLVATSHSTTNTSKNTILCLSINQQEKKINKTPRIFHLARIPDLIQREKSLFLSQAIRAASQKIKGRELLREKDLLIIFPRVKTRHLSASWLNLSIITSKVNG